MTDFPPQPPQPNFELAYLTPPPHGSAPLLVRLAGIFILVTTGIDLLYGAGMIVLSIFMASMMAHMPVAVAAPPLPAPVIATLPATAPAPAAPAAPAPPAPGAPGPVPVVPPPFPAPFIYAIYGGPGLLSLLVITPKIIGAVKLLRRRRRAWAWGLAAAVICCTELWMFMGCCVFPLFPLAAGVYSIIILCFAHVREYLARGAAETSTETA